MSNPLKQHLIDPEICIRCYTCENTCPIQAIEHDDNNVVVDEKKCNFCMDCISVCPTGSIDEWRVVNVPYTLEQQYEWDELPEQETLKLADADTNKDEKEAADDSIALLLAEAHKGAGGKVVAPASASKPTINLYNLGNPIEATVQGNFKLTAESADSDVRHIVLDFKGKPFPVLEGQSVGIIAPGTDTEGNAHLPRLYSVSSPRDGERAGYNNISLTVKRDEHGVCSNYLCDLKTGDDVNVTGPFGSTFLLPTNAEAKLLMVCTGTGSAPMRAFTMARQRTVGEESEQMIMYFGARTPESLPYFGPLKKVPADLLEQHLCYSRVPEQDKAYVQDRMLEHIDKLAPILNDINTHVFICGLREMEEGVEMAFNDIATHSGVDWKLLKNTMREQGRYHVETY